MHLQNPNLHNLWVKFQLFNFCGIMHFQNPNLHNLWVIFQLFNFYGVMHFQNPNLHILWVKFQLFIFMEFCIFKIQICTSYGLYSNFSIFVELCIFKIQIYTTYGFQLFNFCGITHFQNPNLHNLWLDFNSPLWIQLVIYVTCKTWYYFCNPTDHISLTPYKLYTHKNSVSYKCHLFV